MAAAEGGHGLAVRPGVGVAMATGAAAFFGLRFGRAAAGVVPVPLTHLDGADSWPALQGPPPARVGPELLSSPDHLLLHAQHALDERDSLADATETLYRRLLGSVAERGYPHLVRIWNYVPDINRGLGEEERYVRFNAGRKAAFDALGYQPAGYPAATGIGCPADQPLTVVVAASRQPPRFLENPRQTSAYHYPRRYGLRPPAFARATLLPAGDGVTLFVSGTASIVGHRSRHAAIGAQLEETLANLEGLIAHAVGASPGFVAGATRDWQVYLRHAADRAAVEAPVRARLGGRAAFLQAEICRRELLIEIEGTCVLERAAAPTP
jgi:chorismate lyase/3-hydroxybenzoate synthase